MSRDRRRNVIRKLSKERYFGQQIIMQPWWWKTLLSIYSCRGWWSTKFVAIFDIYGFNRRDCELRGVLWKMNWIGEAAEYFSQSFELIGFWAMRTLKHKNSKLMRLKIFIQWWVNGFSGKYCKYLFDVFLVFSALLILLQNHFNVCNREAGTSWKFISDWNVS